MLGILLYQTTIFITLVVTRVVAPHLLAAACLIWTGLTLINLFWPPLIALQLLVIWGTYAGLEPRIITRRAKIPQPPKKIIDSRPTAEEFIQPSTTQSKKNCETLRIEPKLIASDNIYRSSVTKAQKKIESANETSAADTANRDSIKKQSLHMMTLNMLSSCHKEKQLIDTAFDLALLEQTILSQTKKMKNLNGNKRLLDEDAKLNDQPEFLCTDFNIPQYDGEIDEKTKKIYRDAVKEYSELLNSVVEQTQKNPNLRVAFDRELRAMGGSKILIRLKCFEAGREWHSLHNILDSSKLDVCPATISITSALGESAIAEKEEIITKHIYREFDQESWDRAALLITQTQVKAHATARKIPYLIHFTRARNLESILRHGLCSIERARQLGVLPHNNDTMRLDGHTDAVSLSVSFPNHRMFFKYRQQTLSEVWVVLVIDPDVMWEKRCGFCEHNAADHRIRSRPVDELTSAFAFNSMFNEIKGLSMHQRRGLLDCDPTDPQAEILVFDIIEPYRIKGVAFDQRQAAATYLPLKGNRSWQIFPEGQGFFASRDFYRQKGS